MGVEFPKDVFYADYLMQLITGRVTNEKDKNNIAVLRKMWNKISKVPRGPRRSSSSSCWLSQAKISFTRVREIIGLSLYSNKLFKGSSFLITTLLIVGLCSIVLFNTFYILCAYKAVDFSTNSIQKYWRKHTSLFYPNILRCFSNHNPSDSIIFRMNLGVNYISDYKYILKQTSKYYRAVNNMGWISILGQVFSNVFLFAGFLACICSSNGFHSSSFYKTCKVNIKANRFTAGDYMCAQVINVILQKTLALSAISMIIYWALYFTIDVNMAKENTIGHTLPTILLLCASCLISAYSIMIDFAVIPIRWFSFIGFFYVVTIHIIPILLKHYFLENTESFYQDLDPFAINIGIFQPEKVDSTKNSILACLSMMPFDAFYISACLDYAITAYKVLVRYNPCFFFSHILTKMSFYLGHIRLNTEALKPNLPKIEDQHIKSAISGSLYSDSLPVSSVIKKTLMWVSFDEYDTGFIKTAYNHIINEIDTKYDASNAHEILDNTYSLQDTPYMHILWSALCFWLIPIVLIALTALYKYKKLLPNVRN
ncbi:uncharacterized protein NEPG_01328 [Nematocida parisii ERTm1]|uniref:uncharacterized protein n=1 Tax=Nematocida parisii (strain ERTm1 / ATCC PRA-289) TaxID=881290 RepID=UPI000264B35C|nr:uncharacterized protein NEPG_01328 [Nematocida parisii ERTm1]EIJ93756.1 hypothetical protein NEPG_01328 [Nematocida parisii ERTm1]|eukprot:XP_013059156.1 hypothetical protein NEPG_01328 [Nematocida parisii ERTm1]